jgi:hypothetical protein
MRKIFLLITERRCIYKLITSIAKEEIPFAGNLK